MQAVRPENYRPRAIDRRIDQLLRSFGAVEIAGPKWCGKTWTSLAHAGSADLLTDPSTLLAAQSSPDEDSSSSQGPPHHTILRQSGTAAQGVLLAFTCGQ